MTLPGEPDEVFYNARLYIRIQSLSMYTLDIYVKTASVH
jgi:hypothetical protein